MIKAIFIMLGGSTVFADTFGFQDIEGPINISNNFGGEVVSNASGQVTFILSNNENGTLNPDIRAVFFDDSTSLLSNGYFDSAHSSSGVAFSIDSNPQNFAQGNNLSPPFSTAESFDADTPQPQNNAININEYGAFTFNGDLSNIIAAINSGALRIGIHVQSIGTKGDSDSYINTTTGGGGGGGAGTPVPEPATMVLVGMGLIGLGTGIRKKIR
jgi:hypothetical protein